MAPVKLNEELVYESLEVYFNHPNKDYEAFGAAVVHYLENRSLPDRMREAAETLREASRRLDLDEDNAGWWPIFIEHKSEVWEAEDRAEAEQDELVEQLAESLATEANDIWDAMSDLNREKKRVIAKRLLAKYNITPNEQ